MGQEKEIKQNEESKAVIEVALQKLEKLAEKKQGGLVEFNKLYSELVIGRFGELTSEQDKELTRIFALSKGITREKNMRR